MLAAAAAGALGPEPGDAPAWIHLLPLGTVSGRDGRGPYRVRDLAHAQAIIAASRAYAGSADLVVDYDHQTDLAVPRGGTAPAAGWIKALEARADGIWAEVEWTEAARQAIRARHYRYISPVFAHRRDGTVQRLLRAALVNAPNLDLPALAHARSDLVDLTDLRARLGLADGADEAACIAALDALLADRAALVQARAAAGVAADADARALCAAIAALGVPDPTDWVPAAQHAAVTEQLMALQAEASRAAEARATEAVDAAVKAGKIVPAAREHFLALARADLGRFEALAAALPVVLAGGRAGSDTPPAGDALTEDERVVIARMGIEPRQFIAARQETR